MKPKKPVALIILDGWGHREEKKHNAITEAATPNFDKLWENNPHCLLEASGEAVGLPQGQMGNSEVGHTTIGAGKPVDTDLVRITKAALNDEFDHNLAFEELFNHVKKHNSVLHVQGLIGPGGIHSHSNHLYAFLKSAKKAGVRQIAIHAFTDGRDTPPQSANQYLKELEDVLEEVHIGLIATVTGRFYAMDRDNNWDRLEKAEKAIFHGQGNTASIKPSETVSAMHKMGLLDEHLEPIIFLDNNGRSYQVSQNDGVFFFNFRSDRARMISKRIAEMAKEKNLCFVTMTEYDKSLPVLVAFPPTEIETTLAAEISKAGLTQAHIAETEKFAHATYFLNGGREHPHDKEEHILIESRKDISTHDQAPEMRAQDITEKAIESVEAGTDFLFVNFANPDMVGHTGNKEAIIQAIEAIDRELGRLLDAIEKMGGMAFVTADHGNAETNFDLDVNALHTAHTINPVPAILIGAESGLDLQNGTLADIAPTILALLGILKPQSMTGHNLIEV